MQRGDHYDHVVSASFDDQLHRDVVFSHLLSILAMNNVHNVVGELMFRCTDDPEHEDEGAGDREIPEV
jgi:hypothetical protein